MGIGFVLILIPLIFLTGLGGLLSQIHPDEELNDAGIFVLIGLIFLAATVSLVFTWLYHALMESSEWQATVGKKALGLVVTDMADNASVSPARREGTSEKSSPIWCLSLLDTSWRVSPRKSRRCTTCWRDVWCCGETVETNF